MIKREDKSLYTERPKVDEEGVSEDRIGVHYFVVLAVKGEGEPVDFRALARPGGGERDIQRGLPGHVRTILKALQGEANSRAGLGFSDLNDFAGRVYRWEIHSAEKAE